MYTRVVAQGKVNGLIDFRVHVILPAHRKLSVLSCCEIVRKLVDIGNRNSQLTSNECQVIMRFFMVTVISILLSYKEKDDTAVKPFDKPSN